MKCEECQHIGKCKEKAKEPDLIGCTSGIPVEKMWIRTRDIKEWLESEVKTEWEYAELVGYSIYHGERINDWRCPNSKCGMGVSEDYVCCPYCGQRIRFPKEGGMKEKNL